MSDIYLVDFPGNKVRPAVVLTRGVARSVLTNVTVGLITSTVRGLTTEVLVGPRNGLDHTSVINCDAITTVPKRSLLRHVGYLLDDQEERLVAAIARALDLEG